MRRNTFIHKKIKEGFRSSFNFKLHQSYYLFCCFYLLQFSLNRGKHLRNTFFTLKHIHTLTAGVWVACLCFLTWAQIANLTEINVCCASFLCASWLRWLIIKCFTVLHALLSNMCNDNENKSKFLKTQACVLFILPWETLKGTEALSKWLQQRWLHPKDKQAGWHSHYNDVIWVQESRAGTWLWFLRCYQSLILQKYLEEHVFWK